MKTKLLALSIISYSTIVACGPALAEEPYRLEGTFSFENMEHVQTRDVEVVPQAKPDRLLELVKDKYTCEYLARFYRCVKISIDRSIPAELEAEIKDKFRFERFKFKRSQDDVILTNQAPALIEWDIPDTVRTNKEEVKKYHYYLLESGIHKIKLPFKTDEWLLVQNENKVSSHYSRTVTMDRWKMKEFVILVNFTK